MKRWKNLSLFAMALTLMAICLFALPTKTQAATDGDWTYTTVYGKATITDCKTSVSGAVEIPATIAGYPVTAIGNNAFSGCTGLTSVSIPDGVVSIGNNAFYGCSKLTSVTIPASVTRCGDFAFYSCSALTSVYISDMEAWCKIKFTFPMSNPLYFAKNLYLNGAPVTNLIIPDGVTSINNYAFYACNTIISVAIPDSVTSIGRCGFLGCGSLKSVSIPDSVTSIDNSAFSECSCLVSVNIPDSVTDLGVGVFYDCSSLSAVEIGTGISSLGDKAFYGCKALTSVKIPEGVTSIGNEAFKFCSNLKEIEISESVSDIGAGAFYSCCNLTSLRIPGGITEIKEETFRACAGITSVVIPDAVKSIGEDAFSYCDGLRSIVIPDSVSEIGGSAFRKCTNLVVIDFGSGCTKISDLAFLECTSLERVEIPDNITSISPSAFRNCDSLKGILVSDNNPSYSSDSFGVLFNKNKTQLIRAPGSLSGNYAVPESVVCIGIEAFQDIENLTSVKISGNVTLIDTSAFKSCENLETVVMPSSVTEIGYYAFQDCTALNSVTFCGTEEQWDAIRKNMYNDSLNLADRSYHDWIEADCLHPKTCCICGETEGEALGHDEENDFCVTCGKLKSYYWILSSDVRVNLSLTQDFYVDLNGYRLFGTITTNGYKVYGMDSTTNTYSCEEMGYFNCVDENSGPIIPERHVKTTTEMTGAIRRYMTIETDKGYTFHRLFLGVTHTSLNPATTGMGYKAVFYGDDMVSSQLDAENAFGYTLQLADGKKVTRYKAADDFVSGKAVMLRINHFDAENYGEIELSASVCLRLSDGTVIESSVNTTTLRKLVENVNVRFAAYSQTQLQALKAMIEANPVMKKWAVGNIYEYADLQEPENPDGDPFA